MPEPLLSIKDLVVEFKTEDGIEVWPFERFDATVAAGRLWP